MLCKTTFQVKHKETEKELLLQVIFRFTNRSLSRFNTRSAFIEYLHLQSTVPHRE